MSPNREELLLLLLLLLLLGPETLPYTDKPVRDLSVKGQA